MVRHTNLKSRRYRPGTSLVELLVVIVILLVGILAVIQVFPRGLQLIAIERNKTIMTNLARYEIERIRANLDQLPEQILPVTYTQVGPTVTISANSGKNPNDLGPYSNFISGNGQVLDGPAGNVMGPWQYLTGANNFRRVIGEGREIPAPRYVGSLFGGLMSLQFAPVVFNPTTYNVFFQVYGNDMVRRFGDPDGGRVRPYEYYLDQSDTPTAIVYLPVSTTLNRSYRLSMTAWVNNGTADERREIVDANIPVGFNPAGGYLGVNLSAFAGPGVFLGCEYETVRIARNFDRVTTFTVGGAIEDTAYEYMMLDESLGLILFNPTGYKYSERRGNRTVPLVARVNYDVYDWRIIKDDFRIPDDSPVEQHLRLTNLMHKNSPEADHKLHTGLNIFVNNELGGTENRDFILLDVSTGGIYSKASLDIDYSQGILAIKDFDNNPANGVQARLWYPGAVAAVTVDASGRNVRAMYQATGEWAVQASKPASRFSQTLGAPGVAQYYPGGAAQFYTGTPFNPSEGLTRIYFPPMDVGKKVSIGELLYDVAGGGEPMRMENQDFLITNSPIDTAVGLPYIDIRTNAPDALSINYARYGYGVRNVQGSSLTVRVLWNPATFNLDPDEAKNLEAIEAWGRNWRRVQSETMLQKETSQ